MKAFILLLIVSTVAFGSDKTLKLSTTGIYSEAAQAVVTNTYADSQTDNVTFIRPVGLSGLTFAVHFADSVSVTNVIVKRKFNGVLQAAIAGDTLYSTLASTAAAVVKLAAVTLAPLPDAYVFVVAYASSANGVTTPTVTYSVQAQMSR